MQVFYRKSTNPYFNIAAEEYFIKNSREDICMLWINEPSIIIGKHQNAYSEINYSFVKENKIPVIRRISGGGAVYHDLGNINFSFIQHIENNNKVNFNQFTSIIINMLRDTGINASIGKRNSIFIGDKKISGHAEHLFKDKILHHGTLLFDTNLEILNNSLNPTKKYSTKALESVRSEVCNILPYLEKEISITEFAIIIKNWLLNHFIECKEYIITDNDIIQIEQLVENKYQKWDWNYGYSPSYSFDIQIFIHPVTVVVINGCFSDFKTEDSQIKHFLEQLLGKAHKEEIVKEVAEKNKSFLFQNSIEPEGFVFCFFHV